MYSMVKTAVIRGLGSVCIHVEADVSNGMPVFEMVGFLSSEVREAREKARPVLSARTEEIPLWNIWVYYTKDLQLKEAQQKSQTFGAQTGSMFSSVKGYRRTVGGSDKNEEED